MLKALIARFRALNLQLEGLRRALPGPITTVCVPVLRPITTRLRHSRAVLRRDEQEYRSSSAEFLSFQRLLAAGYGLRQTSHPGRLPQIFVPRGTSPPLQVDADLYRSSAPYSRRRPDICF